MFNLCHTCVINREYPLISLAIVRSYIYQTLLTNATYSAFRLYIFSVCLFSGNWTHSLCAANAMLYHWATGTQDLSLPSAVISLQRSYFVTHRQDHSIINTNSQVTKCYCFYLSFSLRTHTRTHARTHARTHNHSLVMIFPQFFSFQSLSYFLLVI